MWYFVNHPSPQKKKVRPRRGPRKGRKKMARKQTAAQRRASLRNLKIVHCYPLVISSGRQIVAKTPAPGAETDRRRFRIRRS